VSGDEPSRGGAAPSEDPLSTVGGGKLSEVVDKRGSNGDVSDNPDPEDMALGALSQAQYITKNSRQGRRGKSSRADLRNGKRPTGYSGSGPDERDPQLAANVLGGLLAERGWNEALAQARVFADWPALVGVDISAHCQPVGLRDGELRITAESSAWATQLRLMAGALLASLVTELGPSIVTKLIITGPVGPTWKHGPWSVRGSRGPRDTYG
jgi:predicted nucleic acid-binding Zn ribbon protein